MTGGARLAHLLRRLLASRRLAVYLVALITSLGLPSLGLGFHGDDYVERVCLLGSAHFHSLDPAMFCPRPILDLHVSVSSDPRVNARLMDIGVLPWWTAPDLRIAPLRPLAALSHWLDYRLWPDSAPLMHAHSLLWAALCMFAAAFLYRRFFGPALPALAGLAACLFAADSSHASPSYQLAFRNGLVALFFGTLAVSAHVRHREEGWRPGAVLAPALLGAALFSAETGVCTMAYIVAHAAFLDRGTLRERARALLPYLPVLILWRLVYVGMGFGTQGSSAYPEPGEPLRFLGALVQRGPVLLLGAWINLDLTMHFLGAGRRLWLAALVASVVVGAVLVPLLRRDGKARFWALGMVLSVAPVCAIVPVARRLTFVSLGAAALLAQLMAATLRPPGPMPRWRRVAVVVVCVSLVLSRMVLGPLLLLVQARPSQARGLARGGDVALDHTVERQTLVVLNPPSAVWMMLLPYVRAVEGRAVPLRIRGLAASRASGTVTRTDDHTLTVRVKGGYLSELDDTLFRDSPRPMRPGQRIELAGVVAEVASIKEDGRPWEMRFRFDVPLEDPSLRWLQWTGDAYAPFRPPGVGGTVQFTAAGVEPATPGG